MQSYEQPFGLICFASSPHAYLMHSPPVASGSKIDLSLQRRTERARSKARSRSLASQGSGRRQAVKLWRDTFKILQADALLPALPYRTVYGNAVQAIASGVSELAPLPRSLAQPAQPVATSLAPCRPDGRGRGNVSQPRPSVRQGRRGHRQQRARLLYSRFHTQAPFSFCQFLSRLFLLCFPCFLLLIARY